MLAVSRPHWVCPRSGRVYLPSLHCSGSRLLCWELSEVGPGLHALPRSKPLRFRFSGTPQRRRLGWACVLCPSQVRAAQVTRCFASAVAPSWRLRLIASPIPAARFSGCTMGAPSQVRRVSLLGSWSLAATLLADVDRSESQEVLASNEAACSLVEDASLGPNAPFRLWQPAPACLPACLRRGMGQSAAGKLWWVLCSVSGPGGVLGYGFSQDGYPVWVAISS